MKPRSLRLPGNQNTELVFEVCENFVRPGAGRFFFVNDHGGLYETSCMLAIKPELVDMNRAKDPVPEAILSEHIRAGYSVTYRGEPFFAMVDGYRLGRAGNLGASPRGANERIGADVLEAYIDYNAGLIGELRKIELKNKETH